MRGRHILLTLSHKHLVHIVAVITALFFSSQFIHILSCAIAEVSAIVSPFKERIVNKFRKHVSKFSANA